MTMNRAEHFLYYYMNLNFIIRIYLEAEVLGNNITVSFEGNDTFTEMGIDKYYCEDTVLTQRCFLDNAVNLYQTTQTRNQRFITMFQGISSSEKWKRIHVIHDKYFADIAEQITELGLLGSSYFITDKLAEKNMTVQVMEAFKTVASSRTELYFIVFGESDLLVAILEQIKLQDVLNNQQGYFTFLHKWIFVISCQTELLDIEKSLGDVNHVAILSCIDMNKVYIEVLDIFSAMWTPNGRKFELIGQQYHGKPLFMVYQSLFPNSNYHFNGRHLKVATKTWIGHIETIVKNNMTMYHGPYFTLIEACSMYLNFTYDIITPPDGTWGEEINGTWYGIPALLLNKAANISIAPLAYLLNRAQVMDYANVPIQYFHDVLLYKKQTPIRNTLSLYAKPFKTEVWIGILATMIIYTFFIHFLSCIINPRNGFITGDGISTKCIRTSFRSYGITLQDILSSFLNQGINVQIQSTSQAILWASWWIFSLIMVSVWAGVLISFLAVKVYPWFPSTLEEIAYDSTHTVGILEASALPTMLRNSTKPELVDIWQKVQKDYQTDPTVLSTDLDVHIHNILTKNYLFFSDEESVRALTAENCELDSNEEVIINTMYASIGMQKNSAYKAMLTDFSIIIMEYGLMDSWLKNAKEATNRNTCMDSDDRTTHTLKFHHFTGWFTVLGFVLSITFIVLLTECLWHRAKGFKIKALPDHINGNVYSCT